MKGVPFLNERYTKGVRFLSKMVYVVNCIQDVMGFSKNLQNDSYG